MTPVIDTAEPFYGTVYLSDWIQCPSGAVRAFRGLITIHTDEEAVGFRNRSGANWLAIVRGETSTYALLGCQLRGFAKHDRDYPHVPDTWVVA